MSIGRFASYNLGGAIIPIVVTLLTVPIYLQIIGVERYGILAIVWVLLGSFGVFDFGLSHATAYRIASLRNATADERQEVFWTALLLNAGLGAAGGLLLWWVAFVFMTGYLQIDAALLDETLSAIRWFIVALPILTVSMVLTGVLLGLERFLALNISNTMGAVLGQLAPLFVAWQFGPNLALLFAAALLGQLVALALQFQQCWSRVPLGKGVPVFRSQLIPGLLHYGGWVTVTAVVSTLMTTFDRLLIGMISGAKAVTHYTIPFTLVSRVNVLPDSLAAAIFPRFSSLSMERCDELTEKSLRLIAAILTPVLVLLIAILEPFLGWWLGGEFSEKAALVGEIVALGLWANGLARIPFSRLLGEGRPDVIAKIHLAEIVPYFLMLYIGLQFWGIVGAAIVWSFRVIIDSSLLLFIIGIAPRLLLKFVYPATLLVLMWCTIRYIPDWSMMKYVFAVIIVLESVRWGWSVANIYLKNEWMLLLRKNMS